MNIDPLNNNSQIFSSFRRRGAFSEDLDSSRQSAGGDHLAADRSVSLRESFATLPEVRPEVVARGRQLLEDPNYPGPAIVAKIASLITPLPED